MNLNLMQLQKTASKELIWDSIDKWDECSNWKSKESIFFEDKEYSEITTSLSKDGFQNRAFKFS